MLKPAREFFREYYEIETCLKYLEENKINPNKTRDYRKELRLTKKSLRRSYFGRRRSFNEDTLLTITDSVQYTMGKIERFVQDELGKITCPEAEMIK